ncbi:protein peste-like isoform X1 [Periplaneta americana]|uniref:protein peste-like isoform X1 n=1 Tax=Periplaneta americana TaxID=6978 RepID=UPI0037E8C187
MEHRIFLKVSGIAMIILGVILALCSDTLFNYVVRKVVSLSPSSILLELWKKTPFPMEFDFYLFNCTNCDSEIEKDFTPEFVQLGPYHFEELHEKVNITWNSNHTVTYQQLRRWFFDVGNSNGTWEDNVTTLNIFPLSVSYITRDWGALSAITLSSLLRASGSAVLTTETAGQLIFDGHLEPFLSMLTTFSSFLPVDLPYDRVGILYGRNNSPSLDGIINMETGAEDPSKIGIVRSLNYKTNYDAFEAECAQVGGSAGDFFPPRQARNSTVQLFVPPICRTLKYSYAEDTEVHGIPCFRYNAIHTMFDNGHTDTDNWCYCEDKCPLPGIQNISKCVYDGPVFLSFPHFLHGDPYLLQQVKGLHPNLDLHGMHITLEPRTGIPLEITVRLQINMLLHRNPRVSLYRNVPTIVFPIIWVDSRGRLPHKYAVYLGILLSFPVVCIFLSIGLIALGLLLILLSVWSQLTKRLASCRKRKNRKCNQENVPEELTRPLSVML